MEVSSYALYELLKPTRPETVAGAHIHLRSVDCARRRRDPDSLSCASVQDLADGTAVDAVLNECVRRRLREQRCGSVMLETVVAPVSDSGDPGDDGIAACRRQAITQTLPMHA